MVIKKYITGVVRLPSVATCLHITHCTCVVVARFLFLTFSLSVGLSCKGLKSAKVLETVARSKKHETIVEGLKASNSTHHGMYVFQTAFFSWEMSKKVTPTCRCICICILYICIYVCTYV